MTNTTMNVTAANAAVPVPVDFELPTLAECDFSSDELADLVGLTMQLQRQDHSAAAQQSTGDPQIVLWQGLCPRPVLLDRTGSGCRWRRAPPGSP